MMGSEAISQSEPAPAPPPPVQEYVDPPPPVMPAKPETIKPIIAGVLLIVVAIMGLIVALVFMGAVDIGLGLFDEYLVEDPTGTATGMVNLIQNIVMVCGIIFMIFTLLALLGGIMSIQRKKWGFALMGAIFGIFTVGYYGIGSMLSIVALILIIISKDEF
ncbi:MAG: hypothetical protein KAJ33_04075 [Thermoplasmata archaeon]|nr:hypothetical protein [Thermoplasmata archaeon]